jgi:hypothetical protein
MRAWIGSRLHRAGPVRLPHPGPGPGRLDLQRLAALAESQHVQPGTTAATAGVTR